MSLFKSDLEKKLQRDLDGVRANRDKLTERLATAELAVIERRTAAQRLAQDGADDGDLDIAEAELRRAQERVGTLSAALGDTKQHVATVEKEQAAFVDQKLRAATAAAIEAMADEVVKADAAFAAGNALLAEAVSRAAEIAPDALGLKLFTENVKAEVPTATKMIAQILRDRARATIAGTAPARLSQAAPAPIEPPPPSATERVFLLRHAKYRDAGVLCLIPKFNDADLPPAVAARALAIGAAVPISDPRRKRYCTQSPSRPNEEWCVDLDADIVPHEPVQHSAFEVVDRGKPYTFKVGRGAS